MPNEMRSITEVSMGWTTNLLPELPYERSIRRVNNDPTTENFFSEWNKGISNNLNNYFVRAMLALKNGITADICVSEISANQYVAEHTSENGDTVIVTGNVKGQLSACIVASDGTYRNIKITKDNKDNLSPLYAVYALLAARTDITNDANIKSRCKNAFDRIMAEPLEDTSAEMFYLNDVLYCGFKTEKIKGQIQNGNIDMLTETRVKNLRGKILCGTPKYIGSSGAPSLNTNTKFTVGLMKNMFASYAATHSWTEEEEKMIPQFADDFPCPKEVYKMCTRYTKSRQAKHPINNFMWRSPTGLGKSTGVKLMAYILHMPYKNITCKSTMDTDDFLSQYVPDNDSEDNFPESGIPEIDSMEIFADPASAYEKLTGEYDENVTSDDVLRLYIKMKTASAASVSDTALPKFPKYKLVDSDYVIALRKGYVLEIAEASRIKDPGVLVGLNEFCAPQAVIRLPNGKYVHRNPDTIVVMTDNVGYQSCHLVDPSVNSRQDYIFDSPALTDEEMMERVKFNTGYDNEDRITHMLKVMRAAGTYCNENDIREGELSYRELEKWVQLIQIEGDDSFEDGCKECIVSKVSADPEVQNELWEVLTAGVLSENI